MVIDDRCYPIDLEIICDDVLDLCVFDAIRIGSSALQSKTVTITENKETKILPDEDYDGLSEVTVITNVDGEHYTGDTTVVPKPFEAQILQTKNKIVDENITVTEIPYFEVSNPYGTTVNIGG